MDKLRYNEKVVLSMYDCLLTKEPLRSRSGTAIWRVYQTGYLMVSTGIDTYALEQFSRSVRAEKTQ